MTGIKPERQRYFVVNYLYRRLLADQEIWRLISSSTFQLFGLKGMAEMGLYLTKNNVTEPFFIVRVTHKHVDKLHAVLCTITQHDGHPVTCKTVYKSGTVKKALEMLEQKKNTNLMTV
ncbi:MAG: Rpp14/Pop5 family protein [Candidatus Odinarchaeota archaeon]